MSSRSQPASIVSCTIAALTDAQVELMQAEANKKTTPNDAPRTVDVPQQVRKAPADKPTLPDMPEVLAETPQSCRKSHRVYLSDEWYVDVDDQGVVLNSCAEGALGYVIQLQPADRSRSRACAALKIPRLRADTIEENANIAQILHAEQRNVEKTRSDAFAGLVPAERRNANFLRRGRRLADHELADARAQDGCVPLVSFRKDARVRICNVRFEPDGQTPGQFRRVVFPKGAEDSISFVDYDYWCEYLPSHSGTGLFDQPVAFRNLSDSGSTPRSEKTRTSSSTNIALREHFHLEDGLTLTKNREVWYAGLPSILFTWAHGTLQESIGEGIHRFWDIWACYHLVKRVLEGLHTLHQNNLVHADLRPANIMTVLSPERAKELKRERRWHELVDGYRLSDYGSFGCDLATLAPTPEGSGHTSMPGVTRHRVSVFYGRERRSGIEREDADLAIIIALPSKDRPGSFQYFLRLGWKTQLQIVERNEVRPSVLKDMLKVAQDMQRTSALFDPDDDWSLTDGDQFRIRDYVFLVKKHMAWNRSIDMHSDPSSARDHRKTAESSKPQETHCLDFLCGPHYTRLLMEKIVLREENPLVRCTDGSGALPSYLQLDLPRWTEIRQTSFASDIYSVGVLALYLPYTAQRRKTSSKPVAAALSSSSVDMQTMEGALRWDAQNIEESVAAIVRRLEDENNFRHLFPELEQVCQRLEHAIQFEIPAQILLSTKVNELDALEDLYQQKRAARETTTTNRPLTAPSVLPPTHVQDMPSREVVQRSANDQRLTQTEFRLKVKNLIETTQFLSEELVVIADQIGNYGHFLFFLHFVLSCLHRKTSLNQSEQAEHRVGPYPFCQNRRDSNQELAAVVETRLRRLMEFRQHTWFFDALQRDLAHVIRKGVPILPDYKIRERLLQLEEKQKQTSREKEIAETGLRQHQELLQKRSEELKNALREREDLQRDRINLHGRVQEYNGRLQAIKQKLLGDSQWMRMLLPKEVSDFLRDVTKLN